MKHYVNSNKILKVSDYIVMSDTFLNNKKICFLLYKNSTQ